MLVAAVVAVALVIGVVCYAAFGHQTTSQTTPPAPVAKTHGKPAVHMLAAGHVGSRGQIPWTLVGSGWTLTEFSTAAPDANGQASASGSVSFYLVDPEGGRYLISDWSAGTTPALLAWSGNGLDALVSTSSGGGQYSYSLLALKSGQISQLSLPPSVSAIGFTRPDGLNILAVRQGPVRFRLERYNLAGAYQKTLATLAHKAGQPTWQSAVCGTGCGALSSPDGDTAVWGIVGDEMQLVDNAGGIIRRLHVPDSGNPSSCVPLSWWNSDTILANCAVSPVTAGASRLWLVPDSGGTPTPLTQASGSASGAGALHGAWQAGSQVYVNASTASECAGAASGPGGLSIEGVSGSPVSVSHSTGNYNAVVGGAGDDLVVLAQTGCPGTSSLMTLNPSNGATQTLFAAPAGQVGVIAAVPFGSGPTATSAGLS